MALYRNLRSVKQAFKHALVRRFLNSQPSPAHLSLKPSFIPWNNSLKRNNLTVPYLTYSSKTTFHHLAEHTLNSNLTHFMNIANWMSTTVKNNPNLYRKKVNYTDIVWPIEKILKEIKINRNDRIFAKSTDYKKLDGLDIKEIYYTNSTWPAEKILKERKLAKKESPKVKREEKP